MAVVRSLVWLFLIIVMGLGATLVVANAIIRAQLKPQKPLIVRDSIGTGSHTLSGVVMVPSPCDEVTIETLRRSTTSYEIVFKTWREPAIVPCLLQETAREFHAVIFAPSFGVSLTASIDGVPIPTAVISEEPLSL